jgi:hypothetical protein
MSAVKALALSAVVLGTATQAATAGAIDPSELNWVAWTPNGIVQTPATTSSLFGAGVTPQASTTPPVAATPPAPAVASPAHVAMAAVAAAPVPAPAAPATPPAVFDAYINVGNGPYPDAAALTTGGAQAWYNSPGVAALFGGAPNAQQRADFTNAVVQRVEQTFALSGVPITLTTDPNAHAAHTLSVVSNTTSTWGAVLGLTNVGGSGFDFVDQVAKVSQNVDQLEWIVAHNVSHELMLAFGVPENFDQTGSFIDARTANIGMMIDPNATFSKSAGQALLGQNFLLSNEPTTRGAQLIGAQTVVPEPSTYLAWSAALAGVVAVRSRRPRASA